MSQREDIPSWLTESENYRPGRDRDGFVMRNLLQVSSTLAFFRLDDGAPSRLSPSAPAKLLFAFGCILLTSLARNYLFVVILLAGLLVRACLLPQRALVRLVGGSATAAGITLLVMLPACLIGQPRSALMLSTKAFVSCGIALMVALTTPQGQLTRSLRSFGMPSIVIMTVDLALHGIVRLGQCAMEILTALRLRSVGRNRDKQSSIGGIGGMLLLKASRSAQETSDAMRCRGFDGSYQAGEKPPWKAIDLAWLVLLIVLVALFLHLQGAI